MKNFELYGSQEGSYWGQEEKNFKSDKIESVEGPTNDYGIIFCYQQDKGGKGHGVGFEIVENESLDLYRMNLGRKHGRNLNIHVNG